VWGSYTVERYDLIFDLRPQLVRVQCKWSSQSAMSSGCLATQIAGARTELLRRSYSSDEIDAFAAYCPDTDRCYFLPLDMFGHRSTIHLRLTPARNNQTARINWAKDFEFAATLAALGAVAQLGEHLTGSQKATGSSPVGSTP
jgi:hypothetical protein